MIDLVSPKKSKIRINGQVCPQEVGIEEMSFLWIVSNQEKYSPPERRAIKCRLSGNFFRRVSDWNDIVI